MNPQTPETTNSHTAVAATNVVEPPESPAVNSASNRLELLLNSCSEKVWGTPQLRPMQIEVLKLIFDPNEPDDLLVVNSTGVGKSHLMRMVGVVDKGVHMIFIPLLTLSADVMKKFETASQRYGSVRAYHLDELFDGDRDLYSSVLSRCNLLPTSTSSTVFVFLSPQHLCLSPSALRVFINCSYKRTLRSIFFDELHLHAAHGMSFRPECRQLTDIFLKPVFYDHEGKSRSFQPRLIGLSATVPRSYYKGIQYLTTRKFEGVKNAIQRGDVESFLNKKIAVQQHVISKADFVKIGITAVVQHLANDPSSKVVVFCNSRPKVNHFAHELERKLNEAQNDSDTIVIHGGLHKNEKFWRIRFFCGDDCEFVDSTSFKTLLSTNAANVGIDHPRVTLVVRFAIPRDLMTWFQEEGRGARGPGVFATCILYATLESYVIIVQQILNYNTSEDNTDLTNEELELQGAGSAISPIARSAERTLQQRASGKGKKKSKYALSAAMKRSLRVRQLKEISEVVSFFFLNKGCQNYRGAFYLANGALDEPDAVDACMEAESCGACPICDGSWEKMHLPVYRKELIRFFESSTGRATFPFVHDHKTPVSSVLTRRPYWVEWIFDRAARGVLVRQIDALIFSLIAADILCLKKNRKGDLVWDLTWVDGSTPRYQLDEVWIGINQYSNERVRKRTVTVSE